MSERHSRRGFMGLTGGALAGALGAPWFTSTVAGAAGAEGGNADLVVTNAKVYTVDTRLPRAEAFAVKNSRFIAVGTNAEIRGLIGKDTRTVDARGMTIVPGFVDCHNHAGGDTLLYEVLVGNPFEVEFVTINSIIDKLRTKARQTPPGTWVEGFFFDDTKVKEQRELNVHDLDEVSVEHPVVVRHRGGHTSYYNSKALEMAGVNKGTQNSAGGTYDRDEKGELNGRVTDTARNVFNGIGKRPTYTPAEMDQRGKDGIAHISKQFVRYGLTTVHHEGGDLASIRA
ncbi:MAG: amidohydrolase family protein [Vicinamibacterales bacterium]